MGNIRQDLQGIQQQRGKGSEQLGSLSVHDTAVRKLQGGSRTAGAFFRLHGHGNDPAFLQMGMGLSEKKLDLVGFLLLAGTGDQSIHALVIPADDLLTGCFAADLVIDDAVARHVDAHVRGRLVGTLSDDLFEHDLQHRENLHIPVIVDRGDPVGLQMEGIDHVDIVQIRRGSLVGQIDRVLERQIPDREGLEFRIASPDPPFVFMINLGEAGSHFSAARSRRGDDHQRPGGLDIIIFTIPLIADNQGGIAGIPRDHIMQIDPDAQLFQIFTEGIGIFLPAVLRDADTADIQAAAAELIHQTQHIRIVGDPQIPPHLVLVDVHGTDNDDDLRLVGQLHQHPQLAVRLKTGKNAGCMIIIKKLSSELQIKLVSEMTDPLANVF